MTIAHLNPTHDRVNRNPDFRNPEHFNSELNAGPKNGPQVQSLTAFLLKLLQQFEGLIVLPCLEEFSYLIDIGVDQEKVVGPWARAAGTLIQKILPELVAMTRYGQVAIDMLHDSLGIRLAVYALETYITISAAETAVFGHDFLVTIGYAIGTQLDHRNIDARRFPLFFVRSDQCGANRLACLLQRNGHCVGENYRATR